MAIKTNNKKFKENETGILRRNLETIAFSEDSTIFKEKTMAWTYQRERVNQWFWVAGTWEGGNSLFGGKGI